jgi:MATE family multidrug resistance protein
MNETELMKTGVKRLLKLFFPFLLIAFTNSIFLLIEKLFLARVSIQGMQVAVNVAYICNIFQGASVALAMMAQVAVGRWFGAENYGSIGPGIWQYIWFSLLSPLVTVPISLLIGYSYFYDTEIQHLALPYFYLMIGINFLYPLGTALACFFSGQGKTRLLLFVAIGSQALKIGMGYLLILGKWGFPSLGLMGGALSTLVAQGAGCLFFFFVFINKKNRSHFNTFDWRFRWELFKECIYPGFLRALNRIISFSCWALIAHLMIVRGEDYALVLSLGGTIFSFLPCLGEALSQAQITILSQSIGAKKYDALKIAARSGYLLALMICLLCVGPFLAFPMYTYENLFPTLVANKELVHQLFFGIFFSFSWFILSFIPLSFILAFRDMNFSLFMGAFSLVNGYLLMLFFLEIVQISANQFWLALSLTHASTALLYYLRAKWLTKKFHQSLLLAS